MKGKENSGTWAPASAAWPSVVFLHIILKTQCSYSKYPWSHKIIIISWGDMWDKGTWQGPGGANREWIFAASMIAKIWAIPILCWQEILAVL